MIKIRSVVPAVRPSGEEGLAVERLEFLGLVEGHAVVSFVDEALAAETGEEATDGFAGDAGHATEFLVSERHGEGDGKVGVGWIVVQITLAAPVEEGAGELTSGGGGKSKAASG